MKRKRLLPLILTVALCTQNIFFTTEAKASTGEKHSVEKMAKAAGYTPIYTIADLAGINSNPSGNYILMNDIDMTEETRAGGSWDGGNGWTPLNEFSGTLDGAGHRIIGMHIYGNLEESLSLNGAGLFSGIDGGFVKNLGMVQVDIDNVTVEWDSNGCYGIGAIAGYFETISTLSQISNCYVTGNITGDGNVGGLVGYAFDISIDNSYNAASVGGNGFIGYNAEGVSACSYCYNAGNVTGSPIASYFWQTPKSIYGLQGKSPRDEYTTMLTEAQMGIQGVFAGFDFGNVWEIDPNSTYKYPQLKSNRHQRVEGMEVASAPAKTIYDMGENIDVSGGTVKLIYEGNYTTTIVMSNDMLENYNTMRMGEQEVTLRYGGQRASFKIMVQDIPVKTVEVTGTGNELSKGNSMQLNAVVKPENTMNQPLTWSSDNPQIATVDETGKVTALQVGNVVISATAENGVSGQYRIKITAPCTLILLDQKELTIYKGGTTSLAAVVSPIDTTDAVSWSSSNTNIVTVDNNGGLTGKAAGSANITVSAGNKTAVCNITVKQKLDDFSITGVVDKEYTGTALEQSVVVTDGKVVLEKEKDYTVSYSDNIQAGTAKVCVTGKGYYEGVIEKSFQITGQGTSGENATKPTETPAVRPTFAPGTDPVDDPIVEEPDTDPADDPMIEESDIEPSSKISIGKTKISKLKNVKGKKLKVTFKKIKGASGYEIRYSTKSNMAGSKIKRTTKTSYTLSSLKKGKKYYVQVRAYSYNNSGKKVYGKWSAKKDCKVKK